MSDTKWTAGERPDGSAYLTTGDYVPGKAHCAFDVECDFEMAQKIALALNSQDRIAQLEADRDALEAALKTMRDYAAKTFDYWDNDADSKVGKRLMAMGGLKPKYDAAIDAALAALEQEARSDG